MKILYVDATGTRGAAERLATCLSKYHAPTHEARALVRRSFFYPDAEVPPPPLWNLKDANQRDACLAWADVVHLIHQTSYRTILRPDLIGRKPTVYQRFTLLDKGDWYATLWDPGDFKHLRLALVAEGWQRFPLWRGLDYAILPMAFDIEDVSFTPLPVSARSARVFFGVMNKKDEPPAPKAYEATVKALNGVKLDVAFRRPWQECMRRRSGSWLSIDEVATPMVHFSTFESLAQGIPCVTRIDDMTRRTVCDATGAEKFPVIEADLESLRVAVDSVLAVDADHMAGISSDLRGWVERHMHPRDVMARYLSFYSEKA